jgi:hypothetical protein
MKNFKSIEEVESKAQSLAESAVSLDAKSKKINNYFEKYADSDFTAKAHGGVVNIFRNSDGLNVKSFNLIF